MSEYSPPFPIAKWQYIEGKTVLNLEGTWTREADKIVIQNYEEGAWPDEFKTQNLKGFDSRLPAYLMRCFRLKNTGEIKNLEGLPDDLKELLNLALEAPKMTGAKKTSSNLGVLNSLGKKMIGVWLVTRSLNEFVGEMVLSLGRFCIGRAKFRRLDFWVTVQECGADALPIVALISFLIGMILAFVGNAQLANFGAGIYVADLVGIAIVREMGVVMTAIIMSGRTGAAFAAHLGSMEANEEIDALRTFGFNPYDFLVLPRVLALVLMMPLLTIYANIIGILGGMLISWTVGITPALFWAELLTAITPMNCSLGVIKSVFFGATIAIAGCMQGMHTGKSSAAVGQATTRAVVASITAIVILDSAFAVIFTILDI